MKMTVKQEVAIVITKYDDEPFITGNVVTDDDYWTVLDRVDVEVEFDMPSNVEIRERRIDALKAEANKFTADAQVKVEHINDEIQKLYALESA